MDWDLSFPHSHIHFPPLLSCLTFCKEHVTNLLQIHFLNISFHQHFTGNLSVLILCGVIGFPRQVYGEEYSRQMCGRNVTQTLASFRTTVTVPPAHCQLDVQKLKRSLSIAMHDTRETLSTYVSVTNIG